MSPRSSKSESAYKTISEVSQLLEVPAHVLRFWETKFTQLKPMKRSGGRRYYQPDDIALLQRIRTLLYQDGFTIKGAQKALKAPKPTAPTADDLDQPLSVASDDLGGAAVAAGAQMTPASDGADVAPAQRVSSQPDERNEAANADASQPQIGEAPPQIVEARPHIVEAMRLLKEAETELGRLAERL